MTVQAAQFPNEAQATASIGESPETIAKVKAASELNGRIVADAKETIARPTPPYIEISLERISQTLCSTIVPFSFWTNTNVDRV